MAQRCDFNKETGVFTVSAGGADLTVAHVKWAMRVLENHLFEKFPEQYCDGISVTLSFSTPVRSEKDGS